MPRTLRKLVFFLTFLALATSSPVVDADPVGDFFKRVGRSISKLGKSSPPPKRARKSTGNRQKSGTPAVDETKPVEPVETATPTPTPIEIRPATGAPSSPERRDVPYGVSVPNRPGLVTSPYAPDAGFVDVGAFPSSTEVMDPFTGKIFLTP
ncbi:MAG: hypothetical protein ABIR38_04520 [Chthoniobacterales bacterium]